MCKCNYNTIAQAQRRWQSFPRIWLHEYIWMTLIQFKSKRIGQGTKAVHMKSAPNNVASVNDTKIYNICQKAEKYKEKYGHKYSISSSSSQGYMEGKGK